jgi:hypothetical protein
VGLALVPVSEPVEEVIPDLLVEVVYCPERGALHKYSQPRPGALRIVDLRDGVFARVPIDAAGTFHTYEEDRYKSPLEFDDLGFVPSDLIRKIIRDFGGL